MARIGKSIIRVKGKIKKDETVLIKTRIIHPNANGLQKDDKGKTIPRLNIEKIDVFFGSDKVIALHATAALSKNPMFNFNMRLVRSDVLRVIWTDINGKSFEQTKSIRI